MISEVLVSRTGEFAGGLWSWIGLDWIGFLLGFFAGVLVDEALVKWDYVDRFCCWGDVVGCCGDAVAGRKVDT